MKSTSIIFALFLLAIQILNAQGIDTVLYNTISEKFATNGTIDIDQIAFAGIQISSDKENLINLNTISKYLENNDSIYIELRLHTDCRGKDTANKALSLKRSKNLQRWFVRKGISAYKIRAIGMGEEKPLVDCKNCDCSENIHSQNRRLELVRFHPKSSIPILNYEEISRNSKTFIGMKISTFINQYHLDIDDLYFKNCGCHKINTICMIQMKLTDSTKLELIIPRQELGLTLDNSTKTISNRYIYSKIQNAEIFRINI